MILKMNIKPILKLFIRISSSLMAILSCVQLFVSWEDIGIENTFVKVIIMIFIILLSLVISIVLILSIFKKVILYNVGKNKVTAIYGDIFKIGFQKKNKNKKIVVIPVNDTFDMIVEEPGENVKKPLVTPNSNHGRWIMRFCEEENISQVDLNNRVIKNLEYQGIKAEKIFTREEREKGNLCKYKLGTIAKIEGKNNVLFYLVAISSFDNNNNAQSNKYYIKRSIETLLDYYDKDGQRDEIYIPLMGTGSSRANLSCNESYKLIKSLCLGDEFNGVINIVIYNGDKEKISIFE